MVNMLEDRDKLQDQLEQYKVTLDTRDQRIHDLERERESLRRQVDVHTQHLPQVSYLIVSFFYACYLWSICWNGFVFWLPIDSKGCAR